MKRMVEGSRDGLEWYSDNDLWFILPALLTLVVYMLWHHG